MSNRNRSPKAQPFPRHRPDIVITPSKAKPFAVDFRELPWWFGIPVVGNRSLGAIYYPPDWTLTEIIEMHAVRPASIHATECVELEENDWEPEKGWTMDAWKMYGRLTEDAVQWLATFRIVKGKRVLYTFLDEGFDEDWGEMPRRLEDRGRFVLEKDGSFKQRRSRRHCSAEAIGAGMFRVRIGERALTCLRVLDVHEEPSEKGILFEAYLTRTGRTVLGRRYNGRQWGRQPGSAHAKRPPWDERFPKHNQIVIDGVMFVHWYDCLSGLAVGITQRRRR